MPLIDAKLADFVLLCVDGSYGFEMETFEFLNATSARVSEGYGGTDTFDHLKSQEVKRRKKVLKQRFWTEIYDGAKLFYISGISHGRYNQRTL